MSSIDEILKTDIAFKGDFVTTPTGDFDTISGLENVKEAIFRRLITVPGSIIHRPNYGVGIKNFQNTISSLPNQRRLAERIRDQLEQDERVQSVKGVQFKTDAYNPELIQIFIRVAILGYGETTFNFLPFGDV